MSSEWTTVVRHRAKAPTRQSDSHSHSSSYMTEKKNREILERVQQGSLDPSEAARMLNSSASTRTNAFQRKSHTRTEPKFTLTRNGGIALHGFHMRPIVLYANRWQELKTYINSGALETFLEDNKNEIRRPNKPWHGSALITPSSHSAAEPEPPAPTSAPASAPTPAPQLPPNASNPLSQTELTKDKHADKPTLFGE